MTKRSCPIWIGAAFAALISSPAAAWVDVELDNGRHVIGESVQPQGDKLVVYRPIGAIEVDQKTVRSIQQRSGEMPADAQRNLAPSVSATLESPDSPSASLPATSAATDPDSRRREITTKLFEVYRLRLAAKNRGDDEAFQKYEKESKQLEHEREALVKRKTKDAESARD